MLTEIKLDNIDLNVYYNYEEAQREIIGSCPEESQQGYPASVEVYRVELVGSDVNIIDLITYEKIENLETICLELNK